MSTATWNRHRTLSCSMFALLVAAGICSHALASDKPTTDPHHDHLDTTKGASSSKQVADADYDLRSPDYSDGVTASHTHGMHGGHRFLTMRFDRLETWQQDGERFGALELRGSYGGDINKLGFRLSGESGSGERDGQLDVFWQHAVAAFWDTTVGLRRDVGNGKPRDWLAVGIQGLAPYWFEVDATAFVGPTGRTALQVNAEYELHLTQRWILQPSLETDLYGQPDRNRLQGSGLSTIEAGVRLRYDITRKFGPYVGVTSTRAFGDTARWREQDGESAQETSLVAGLRFWF